jgi:hypothetical protein
MTEEVAPIHGQVDSTPTEWVAEPHYEEPVVPVVETEVVEVIAEPMPEVVVEPTPAAVEEITKSKNEEPVQVATAHGPEEKVVHTSSLIFKSSSHNSASVALVQERLVEMGFADAGSDKYGWLCEGTMKALAYFSNTTVEMCDPQDASVIEALFAGTQVAVLDCK